MLVLDFKNKNNGPYALAVKAVLEGNIPDVAQCQRDWQEKMPDVLKVVKAITDVLELPDRCAKLIHAAAELAAEPNPNPFHGNRHFLEVFLLAAVLGKHALSDKRLQHRDFGNLLAASLVHDYHHDGKTNGSTPWRLEAIACDDSADALRAGGADEQDLADIRAYIYATNVDRDFTSATAMSPADKVKAFLAHDSERMPHEEMKVLFDLYKANIAQMLQDADVGTSLLAKDVADQRSRDLALEQGRKYDPGTFGFFLQVICHWRMFSRAGFALIQPHMNKTMIDCGFPPGKTIYPQFKATF